MFGKEFWAVATKGKLDSLLRFNALKLGDLKVTKISRLETRITEGTNPSADYYFEYQTTYTKADATETLHLIKEKDGQVKILAYNINSNQFLK